MRCYLGIDNGGTVTKAALYNPAGEELAVFAVPTDVITPKSGYAQRDMEELWQANCEVIRGVLDKAGAGPADIAAVGLCGHGKGLYLWGKDGKPARGGIVSSDNRAWEYPVRWRQDGTEARAFALSCQHIMACQPVPLLHWIKDREPDVIKNIRWIFECKDYVRFRLTGEAYGELTDYSGSGLVNLHTRSYDRELLKIYGLEELEYALPPLRASLDVCGAVTREAAALCGLAEGTPVAAGMFDIDACALATGVTDPSRICMIAGTWSINEYIAKEPVLDGSVQMNSLFCLPQYYLVEESSATSAGNSEWFVRRLLPELCGQDQDVYRTVNAWVESVEPEEFVPVFLPFLMASNVHPNAKGTFVGISTNHSRKHLARAVYEGIAFCHRHHLEKLLATRTQPPVSIRLAGRLAKSHMWTQMFADVMQLPVETVPANETGALGCAIAAACASGDFESLEDAAAAMVKVSEPVLPDPEKKEIYDRKYALYRKAIECLDPLWSGMQELAGS